jgi:tetraprenyl-beta-curcumene synthase
MTIVRHRAWSAAVRDIHAMLATLLCYWVSVFPVARRELACWQERAEAIPDGQLRGLARETLACEHLNAEGAAIFAILAPPMHRRSVTRLLVTYQVMYDYLDTLTERPVPDPLANSRCLHRALTAAIGLSPPADGSYVHEEDHEDGGYLDDLIGSCRGAFEVLPGAAVVASCARRSVVRSAEGQSKNHAAMHTDAVDLACWAIAEAPPDSGLHWWETAAAAGSSLATHALLAAAADPTLTLAAVWRIEAAYWPWVNGLNTLLESLVDRSEDALTGNHSYVSHYATPDQTAERLGMFAGRAADAVGGLPRGRRHAVILAAMASFYLAAPGADVPDAREAVRRVREELGTDIRLLLAILRLRRRIGRWFTSRGSG